MKDRITIEGRNGAFGAYIARAKTLPAPAVVVLHEVFGVNADIRKTCDELAEQGFIAVAPRTAARQLTSHIGPSLGGLRRHQRLARRRPPPSRALIIPTTTSKATPC
jgi:dienelactone hydrolase